MKAWCAVYAGMLLVLVLALTALAQPYLLWNRIYEGSTNQSGRDVKAIDSTSCIIVGNSLTKIDLDGNFIWRRNIGGNSIIVCQQGFVICGSTSGGSSLVKTDSAGSTLWQRTHIGDTAYDVLATSDGGFAFTGVSSDSIMLVKTDSAGFEDWHRIYRQGTGYGVRQTSDGGFLIAAEISIDAFWDVSGVYVIKTDSVGDTLWTRILGDSVYYRDVKCDLELTADGGCIVVGTTNNYTGLFYPYAILLGRLNAQGDTLWVKAFGDASVNDEYYGNEVVLTPDGGFIVAGEFSWWVDQFNYSGIALKVDSLGNEVWRYLIEYYPGMDDEGFLSLTRVGLGGYVIVGYSGEYQANRDLWAVRLNEHTGVRQIDPILPSSFRLAQNYPNPFNPTTAITYGIPQNTHVTLAVFNILGQKVATLVDGRQNAGQYTALLDADKLSSGIYFYRLEAGQYTKTRKMVLLR